MSTGGVTLADKLKLNELPLATTPGGKSFVLKALHPSEHTIKTTRVPGGNLSSVALCADMVETIPVTAANSSVFVSLAPSIVVPAAVSIFTPGSGTSFADFYNPAFGGSFVASPGIANTNAVMANMIGKISRYRITSQSATVELIAPALSDQGTITAAQYNIPPLTIQPSWVITQSGGSEAIEMRHDVHVYPDPVATSAMLLGTSAYTSKAREGCYMPLKLTDFNWQDMNDPVQIMEVTTGDIWTSASILSPSSSVDFPYHENRNSLTTQAQVPLVPRLCGSGFGRIVVAGLAKDVAVRIRVRQVVEINCLPSTTYAPMLELALPPDPTSLAMYNEISTKMADAYPASYNDLGMLARTIMSLAREVLPYVDPVLDAAAKQGGVVGKIGQGLKKVKNVAVAAAPVVQQGVELVKQVRKSKSKNKPASGGRPQITIQRPGEAARRI